MITRITKLSRNLLNRLGIDIIRYQKTESATYRKILDNNKIDLVLDVGANKGQYVSFLRSCGYSGKIISFEPLADVHSQLLKISQKDSLWQIAPRMALGNSNQETQINVAANSQSSSLLPMLDSHLSASPGSEYIGSEKILLNRLDHVIDNFVNIKEQTTFLKIDVQGYEKQVLEGAQGILSDIKGIQLELSLVNLYEGEPLLKDMLHHLENMGYSLQWLKSTFSDKETGQIFQIDGVFFK